MTYALRDLKDTVVAITGATSGIGKATAEQLVELGAKVSLGARNAERLHALVEQLGPDNAVAVPMDVRSVEDNQALINAAVEKFGKIDSIVPNAGIGIYGSILDHSDDELRRMMHTNYDGTVWTIRAGVPEMLKTTGSGRHRDCFLGCGVSWRWRRSRVRRNQVCAGWSSRCLGSRTAGEGDPRHRRVPGRCGHRVRSWRWPR